MNKRTISRLNFSRIPAGPGILVETVASGSATGKMAAVHSMAAEDAPPAGNSPVLPFYPRHMSKNKTLIKRG
jgi:hypothetical protein